MFSSVGLFSAAYEARSEEAQVSMFRHKIWYVFAVMSAGLVNCIVCLPVSFYYFSTNIQTSIGIHKRQAVICLPTNMIVHLVTIVS